MPAKKRKKKTAKTGGGRGREKRNKKAPRLVYILLANRKIKRKR